jgi:pimeloyl-ACP methyl ester carboxylesterase
MPRKLSDDQLRRLTTPTLLYMAENSEVYDPVRTAARADALMPDVETVTVENAQRGLPYTHPDRTVKDVLDFIARHDAATHPAP